MAYVKITDNSVAVYPYSIGQLRRDNSKTSFPKRVSPEILMTYGVYEVAFLEPPEINPRDQKIEQESKPSLVKGVWTLGWVVSNKTDEEVAEYDEEVAQNIRLERNNLLTASDWTQVVDAPVDQAAWAEYRQALRDITSQEGFPHNVVWPVKP